ncbi:MAG: PaaI family thioesterase, partial [Paludibacteraceae bacterium]|nr:PaaI family thioesterase [Paludibacteraceae bacterium]
MNLLKNPWISTPGYNCFGCSPNNPIGTRMRFYEDGDAIVCFWHPTPNHQSWLNTLHGGIQATLLDEVCG